MTQAQALIIDDERDICELVQMTLEQQGVEADSVYSIKEAIKQLKTKNYNVIFCDVRLPDGDGLDLLSHINKHYAGTPVCIMTAHGSMDMAIRALKLGAFDFINKPFSLKQLRSVCRNALKTKANDNAPAAAETPKTATTSSNNAEKENKNLKTKLIGESEPIQQIREMISKVSKSLAPVFIHGESGTGKEVVARSIHEQSVRSAGAFIAVNCGAIPANLMESEFFGYKKGAFTGADKDTDGLFVAANGGTLFLDEIADLPLDMQVKLLRAIQERAVRPIGGDKEEFVDVRIISATHRDLQTRVKQGQFREDLFYRLNVISLDLPPLREREGDIILLAKYLLEKLTKNMGITKAKLSEEAINKIAKYDFPGNVRELENVLERALTFMNNGVITEADIHITPRPRQIEPEPIYVQQPQPQYQAAATMSYANQGYTSLTETAEAASAFSENGGFNFELSNNAGEIMSNYAPSHNASGFARPTPNVVNTPPVQPQTPRPSTTSRIREETIEEDSSEEDDEPVRLRGSTPSNLDEYMQDVEREMILKILRKAEGDKAKAADMLGITPRSMRYKLKKFGIELED